MNEKPIVFLFSGQGSHYYQMGKQLFLSEPTFKYWMEKADNLFHAKTGLSVLKELYSNEKKISDLFDRMLLTHPAIFMLEYALAQTLMQEGIQPNVVLGTSLGELTALTIAGCLQFEDALQIVISQAQSIEQCCEQGSMMAILASPSFYNSYSELNQKSDLAGINFNQHFVISTLLSYLKEIEIFLSLREISMQRLAVQYAFHSRYIDPAEKNFLNAIKQFILHPPKISVISSVYAAPLTKINTNYLWDLARKPILFQSAIKYLEQQNSYCYIDLGPSGTLANFVKYNLSSVSQSKILSLLHPFNRIPDTIIQIKTQLRESN